MGLLSDKRTEFKLSKQQPKVSGLLDKIIYTHWFSCTLQYNFLPWPCWLPYCSKRKRNNPFEFISLHLHICRAGGNNDNYHWSCLLYASISVSHSVRVDLINLIYRYRNWGLWKWNNLPKNLQLVHSGAGISFQMSHSKVSLHSL